MRNRRFGIRLQAAISLAVCLGLVVGLLPVAARPAADAAPPSSRALTPDPQRAATLHLPLILRSLAPAEHDLPPLPPGFAEFAGWASGTMSSRPQAPNGSLIPGWNLLSVAVQPADTAPAAVLASIAGSYRVAYAYNGCDAADPWKIYDPAAPALSDLTVIDPKIGFWVAVTNTTTLTVAGAPPGPTPIRLCRGWNLIGYPLGKPLPVLTALASIAGSFTRVFAYDPADPADPWALFDVAVPGWVNDLQVMEPDWGYWVLATRDATLTIVEPTPTPTVVASTTTSTATATPTRTPTPTATPTRVPGQPPVVSLTSPAEQAEITERANLIGTVRDPDGDLTGYRLQHRQLPGVAWTTFATGTLPVTNAALGALDPTLLLNGMYELQVVATDSEGNETAVATTIFVAGAQKVGVVRLAFTDVDVPLVGIPIQVVRAYDSRMKTQGDFGIGWTLMIRQGSYVHNRTPGEGWQINPGSGFPSLPCMEMIETASHFTEVRLSDTEYYRFRIALENPSATTGGCFADARFDFVDGWMPGATLQILGNRQVLFQNGTDEVLDTDTLLPYEPDQVRLTTVDGRTFDLDVGEGITRLQDLNGNTLAISRNGVIHSNGKSITVTRDGQGRVAQITDPMGRAVRYGYNAAGDLVSHTDQISNVTRFTYNTSHYLLDIIDPNGITAARNEYDESGRLVAHVDAKGNRIEYTHDIGVRQEIVKDRRGNVTAYNYDARGNILSLTDPLGHTTNYTYDTRGNQLTHTDPLGNITAFTYDVRNNLLTRRDALGNQTTFTYNARNQELTVTDPLGNTTTNAYDAKGNLLTTRDSLGSVITNTYNASGNLLSTSDSLGHTISYQYDEVGNRVGQIDAEGNAASVAYDANGKATALSTTRSDELGGQGIMAVNQVYDARGQVTQVTDAAGNTTSTEYNALGRPATSVDANGNRTTYTYDDLGNLSRTTYPDGATEMATYDAAGNRLSATDRAGRTTQFQYDALNRLTSILFSDGSSSRGVHERQEYDAAGRISATVDAGGNRTTYEYDAAGRNTKVIDALGGATTFTFDAAGHQTSVTDANGNTTRFEYDANGRETRTIFPDGSASSATYDALGHAISKTDQAGNITRFEYNIAGLLNKVTDALGQVTSYGYDELGHMVAQTDANGRTTRWTYNNAGQITKHTRPLGMSETLTYDRCGNVLSRTDFNGQTIAFTYDVNHRLTGKTYPDSSQVVYTYTAAGQLAAVADARGVISYTYDVQDRLTRVTNPDGTILSYAYDVSGNRASLTAPSGTTTYAYDALNRLSVVTDPHGGVTHYVYDNVGNRTGVTYPNGTTTTYAYDSLNRLTSMVHKKPDGQTLASYTYTLGPAGNRLGVTEHTGRIVNYTYDGLFRLIKEEIIPPGSPSRTIQYTYDPVGNRLSKTDAGVLTLYTYDANDRLLTENGISYTYDNNGNTVGKTGGGAATVYAYDYENRLVTMTAAGNVSEYRYDDGGNRVRATINGVITNYLVDVNRNLPEVLEERNSLGGLIASFVHGDDLISQERGGNASYYHYDGQMSTRLLTNAAGQATDTYAYDAFGLLLDRTGTTDNAYLYTGEQFDASLGFYYLRARYLNPSTGRFITADTYPGSPFDPASLHKYLYVGGDPINHVDPAGLFEFSVAGFTVTIGATAVLQGLGLFAAFKALSIGMNVYLEQEIEWFSMWDLLDLVPGSLLIGAATKVYKTAGMFIKVGTSVIGRKFAAGGIKTVTEAFQKVFKRFGGEYRRSLKDGRTIVLKAGTEGTDEYVGALATGLKGKPLKRLGPQGGLAHLMARHLPEYFAGKLEGVNALWPLGTTPGQLLGYLHEAIGLLDNVPDITQAVVKLRNGISAGLIISKETLEVVSFFPLSGPGVTSVEKLAGALLK